MGLWYSCVPKRRHSQGNSSVWRFAPLYPASGPPTGLQRKEIDIPQSPRDAHRRVYGAKTYLGRFFPVDHCFLTRFNQKPLRGAGGAICLSISIWAALHRPGTSLFDISAADRPLLVVFSLLLVVSARRYRTGGRDDHLYSCENSRPLHDPQDRQRLIEPPPSGGAHQYRLDAQNSLVDYCA